MKTEQTEEDRPSRGPWPGEPGAKERLARMIRVDHAGEYGAKRIYEGQMAVLGKGPKGPMLRHMADQEAEHLAYFEQMIGDRRVRPTVLQPVWHMAGFALGVATALMGERAAMACTVAVEEVIDEHYQNQVAQLGEDEPEITEKIERFRAEELEHRDIGLEHGAEEAVGYPVLRKVIATGSRAAIWLSERL